MKKIKLNVLTHSEYEFLIDKDPQGFFERSVREKLFRIIRKLETYKKGTCWKENRLYKKFQNADFGLLLPIEHQSEGSLKFNCNVCLEGRHEGDITVNGIFILTEPGNLRGNVYAKSLYCKGKIVGDVEASHKVKVYPTGMLMGDLKAPSIKIEPGALFQGQCKFRPKFIPEVPKPRKSLVSQLFSVG